jgi:CelD/BcsL family acetyltransferase involved in cellulose biosynthesis
MEPSLRLTRLESLADMTAVAGEWRALERRSTAPLTWFQTYNWCHRWMVCHGDGSIAPLILALWNGPRLAAVWPLMRIRKAIGITVVRSLGEPHTQYAGILTENGTMTKTEITLLREGLMSVPNVDCVILGFVPEGSPLNGIQPTGSPMPELANEAAFLDLGHFPDSAAFLARQSKSQRRSRKKTMSVLSEKGEVGFSVLRPGDSNFETWLQRCVQFKRVWLKQTGRVSLGLDQGDHAAFLASLSSSPESADGPYLFALTVAGSPVAIEIGFLRNGHYYSYLGGFDWSLRQISPGRTQMEMTVSWLIDNGAKAFDLLANPTGYKEHWTNSTIALSGHIVNFTPAGRAYTGIWTRNLRPVIKKGFESLPADFRVGFGLVRQMQNWPIG